MRAVLAPKPFSVASILLLGPGRCPLSKAGGFAGQGEEDSTRAALTLSFSPPGLLPDDVYKATRAGDGQVGILSSACSAVEAEGWTDTSTGRTLT